jgi:hypothetical protein
MKLFNLIFILALLSSCIFSSDDNKKIDSTKPIIDEGPEAGSYDYCVSLSYSDPQPLNGVDKKFYILITTADENSSDINSVSVKINGETIAMEYANYGKDFYIANFDQPYNDQFSFEIEIDGRIANCELSMPKEVDAYFPNVLESNQDLMLEWDTAKDPQVIGLHVQQQNYQMESLSTNLGYYNSKVRSTTIPSEWLWSVPTGVTQRAIELFIQNYHVENRVCFTLSDSEYRVY